MNYDDYSKQFDLMRRTLWAEELVEELAQQLHDAQTTAKGLLKMVHEQGLDDSIRTYRQFKYRYD